MMFYVLEPDSTAPGQYCSIDYDEDLTRALEGLRHWRWSLGRRDLALAKGRNGEALHYVMFTERKGEAKQARSVHRTRLGAKRAFLKFGRSSESGDPELQSWGWEAIATW
jgi:hypothetical protein